MAEHWYSRFETDDGLARQCRECGSTTWPASPDPERSAPVDHDPTCAVGATERLTAERAALREAADELYAASNAHYWAYEDLDDPDDPEWRKRHDALAIAMGAYHALAAARGPAGSGGEGNTPCSD